MPPFFDPPNFLSPAARTVGSLASRLGQGRPVRTSERTPALQMRGADCRLRARAAGRSGAAVTALAVPGRGYNGYSS